MRGFGFEKMKELIRLTDLPSDVNISFQSLPTGTSSSETCDVRFIKRKLEDFSDSHTKMASQSPEPAANNDKGKSGKAKKLKRDTTKERRQSHRSVSRQFISAQDTASAMLMVAPELFAPKKFAEDAVPRTVGPSEVAIVSSFIEDIGHQAIVGSEPAWDDWDWFGDLLELELFAEETSV